LKESRLRNLPSVDSLLGDEKGRALVERFGREAYVKACRDVLEELRSEILSGQPSSREEKNFARERIFGRVESRLRERFSPSLQKAVNATGILMHSGLGRAVLSEAAREALDEITRGYCNLALEVETGRRGQRDSHVSRLLCELTGAEAATLANNNAAATVLILNTLARGKEVVVSRGQLVEIGGSFRMPDVMKTSGAILREVGTTNKTHLRDYAEAINETTGAILRVHHSNYRIVGFAEEPAIEDLAELGKKHNIPVIDDLGSGALVDLQEFGLQTEPLIGRSIRAGVPVACFSGDKLIGGPQSGIIVGKADVISRIKKNPLARALRCGKMTIAALEATLKLFLAPEKLKESHPLYRMLSLSLEDLEKRARRMERALLKRLSHEIRVSVEDGGSQVGSGSVPVETIPTKLLSVKAPAKPPDEIARELRLRKPPIFTRIHKDAVLFDLRTIQPDEDRLVQEAILEIFEKSAREKSHD
jgi:L-seryl-tRNA(Ser) seleniumtransferase